MAGRETIRSAGRARPREALARAFERSLRRLERAATVAVVPGEARAWCAALRPALDALFAAHERDKARQDAALDEIRAADRELATRVSRLRREASDLRLRLVGLEQRLTALVAECDRPAEGSAEPTEPTRALRLDLLTWIVDARALGGEVRTWFAEAQYRDRGRAD